MSPLDDLVAALENARTSVFRLEAHQEYADDELWQAHLRGEWWEQDPDLTEWCSLVSGVVDRGVTWDRARVVVEPWTPYTRWEIERHYPHNIAAGERVWLCPATITGPDFWLIDKRAWLLDYGPDGAMTVVEATSRAVRQLRTLRDDALAVGTLLTPSTPATA